MSKAEMFTEGEIGLKAYLKIGLASPYNIFTELQFDLNDKVAHQLIQDEQKRDLAQDLHKITVPALILASRFDDQAPAEELQFIYDQIGSGNKSFTYLWRQAITFFWISLFS